MVMLHQIVYYNNVMYLLSIARYIYPKSFVGFVEHNKVIDEVDTAALHNNKTQAQVHVDLCIKSNCVLRSLDCRHYVNLVVMYYNMYN